MPKCAYYDHTLPNPQPVRSWVDTDFADYPDIDPADLFELTEQQWADRSLSPSVLDNGQIVVLPPLPPPPVPIEEQAQTELNTRIAAGIGIASTSVSAIDSTYALDSVTLTQIGSVARDSASGIGLPLGLPTFAYPDLAGTLHTFTAPQVIALYQAMRDLLYALNTQTSVMAHGGSPAWPTQSATIL